MTTKRLAKLKELLTTLTLAEERVRKVSAWTWRAGAVNSLATAILLPNLIWLLQGFVGKFLFRSSTRHFNPASSPI
jgi:hypothetical protein